LTPREHHPPSSQTLAILSSSNFQSSDSGITTPTSIPSPSIVMDSAYSQFPPTQSSLYQSMFVVPITVTDYATTTTTSATTSTTISTTTTTTSATTLTATTTFTICPFLEHLNKVYYKKWFWGNIKPLELIKAKKFGHYAVSLNMGDNCPIEHAPFTMLLFDPSLKSVKAGRFFVNKQRTGFRFEYTNSQNLTLIKEMEMQVWDIAELVELLALKNMGILSEAVESEVYKEKPELYDGKPFLTQ